MLDLTAQLFLVTDLGESSVLTPFLEERTWDAILTHCDNNNMTVCLLI